MDRKSTFRRRFTLGYSMVSWCSRKQTYVALSTIEIDYITLCMLVHEAMWLRTVLLDLSEHVLDSTIIHYGNQSCVKISYNLVFMTNRTTLRSSTITSETWCRGRKYWCSNFLQMSRLLMFLPNQDEFRVLT